MDKVIEVLDEWCSKDLIPLNGVVIKRSYNPINVSQIELIWTIEYTREGCQKELIVKDKCPRSIDSINHMIDVYEFGELCCKYKETINTQ